MPRGLGWSSRTPRGPAWAEKRGLMSSWKALDSPKLGIPLELREVTAPDSDGRVWEVQELQKGSVFKATLAARVRQSTSVAAPPLGRGLKPVEIERAVCLAVEEALLSPPEKEPGITYEISVTNEHVREAAELSA